MGTRERKNKLRTKMLERRESIREQEFFSASQKIINKLTQQPAFTESKTIHCYVSMNNRREVNTHDLLKHMLEQGKELVVPVTNFEDGTLNHIRLSRFEDLALNKWGVLEPDKGKEVRLSEIELIIVPMVAADEQGNRIGYGKGFYDRFLAETDCPTIGLIFEQNILSKVPTEDFDIPLDTIITEQRVIDTA